MSLKIDYKQITDADQAYAKVKELITPEYIAKFQVKADINYDDVKKQVTAKGSGFKLDLCFLEKHCEVDLDLSFLLKPLKGKILEKIEGQIKKNL
ncbi:polyhydroxyalkanoic acid system family protein [Bacteriovorax sp. PP10]|uniref:Polyhydroxyalkanoic acid system family protein n=1 Tax=Bacteriovorax antarcticus TaxID=3088717 RepID=A0ABU5W1G5_9BACT|nr:polyhydroxyalkanoic acid system family protein [Bacteriovorax sp. PP10]MEA9358100.1 polyhydroxyalkanoic acid system family protein [Bacteriovorax sp. PP10]